jgi:hypothetical protein
MQKFWLLLQSLGFFSIILLGFVFAQTNYDVVTLDVNISESTILDVNPNSTVWNQLSIGTTSSYQAFYVENVGSRTITTISANVTFNASNPYGSATAGAFDAGNFILMNSSDQGTGAMKYINKREWNESKPDYVTAPTGWTGGTAAIPDADVSTFLRFKSAQDGSSDGLEYFMFANRSSGVSNDDCTDGTLYISNFRHTRSETGDIDFSVAGNYTSITLTDDGTNGIGNVSMDGKDTDFYCVRVSANCQTVDFFYWNNGLDDASEASCNNDQQTSDTLTPGSSITIYLQARIPFGVAAGTTVPGTVTLIASPA